MCTEVHYGHLLALSSISCLTITNIDLQLHIVKNGGTAKTHFFPYKIENNLFQQLHFQVQILLVSSVTPEIHTLKKSVCLQIQFKRRFIINSSVVCIWLLLQFTPAWVVCYQQQYEQYQCKNLLSVPPETFEASLVIYSLAQITIQNIQSRTIHMQISQLILEECLC